MSPPKVSCLALVAICALFVCIVVRPWPFLFPFSGTNQRVQFWGKVVDDVGSSVEDAEVEYEWQTEHGGFTGWAASEVHHGRTTTDRDGGFFIHGFAAHWMEIEVIKKDDYRMPNSFSPARATFNYFGDTPPGKFIPERSHPVVFTLVRDEVIEPLVRHESGWRGYLSVPADGTPARWDLWAGKPNPNGELKIVFTRVPEDLKLGEKPRTWSAKLELIGGGMLPISPEEVIFRAPEEGYSPSIDYPMEQERPGLPWHSFYLKTAEGNYGRLRTVLREDDDGPTVRFFVEEAHLNPKPGARLLEFNSILSMRAQGRIR